MGVCKRPLDALLGNAEWRRRLGLAARQRALDPFSLPSLARRHQTLDHRLRSP